MLAPIWRASTAILRVRDMACHVPARIGWGLNPALNSGIVVDHSRGRIIILLEGNHHTWLPNKVADFKVTLEVCRHDPDKVRSPNRSEGSVGAPLEASPA